MASSATGCTTRTTTGPTRHKAGTELLFVVTTVVVGGHAARRWRTLTCHSSCSIRGGYGQNPGPPRAGDLSWVVRIEGVEHHLVGDGIIG